MSAVSVDGKAAEEEIFDRDVGIIDRLPQNDHRTIGPIRQMQNGRVSGPAQGLMISLQHDGLSDFNQSGRQQHFPAAFRQEIQRPLDFGAGRALAQRHHHRFRGGNLGGNDTCHGKNQQTSA